MPPRLDRLLPPGSAAVPQFVVATVGPGRVGSRTGFEELVYLGRS